MIQRWVLAAPPSWSGRQLAGNWDVIWYYSLQHLRYTLFAVVLGALLALPLSYAAVRNRQLYPVLLAVTNALYSIPAITMFVVLGSMLGYLNDKPVVVAMAIYTLVILVRNVVEAVRSVPESIIRSADGMGYRPVRRFVTIELPLALPGVIAGLRLATVSTVSMISVAGIIGRGALGRMFIDGFRRNIDIQVWAAMIAVVVLALALDLAIFLLGRAATPWTRVRQAAV